MLNQDFFYPLFGWFDKDFFRNLQKAVKEKYRFIGENEDKIFFLKSLLCFQMIKNYRIPLYAVKKYLKRETDLEKLNKEIKLMDFKIDHSWAVWLRDKKMGRLAKKFFKSRIRMIGTDEEFNEFVLRYLISIWLIDWEGPLYVLLQLTKKGIVNLHELNDVLSMWDFTKIFDNY